MLGSGRAGASEQGAWHNGLYVAVVRKTKTRGGTGYHDLESRKDRGEWTGIKVGTV